ncbi:MAG TPA: hypothetical protein VHX65_11675, partial [Pirellulales bacterium]|nr:hypothetical protein [Pirellulales bacterium]
MADEFNPYHVWLAIPPEEQPANYYRLLGLRLFETNADVVDSAADRQMAHLRTFQSGKHGELSQRLLNEVAAARVCLLDPKKRAVYDQRLRAKLPAMAPAAQSGATAGSGIGIAPLGPIAPGGSAIQRQPPRRLPTAAPAFPQAAAAVNPAVAPATAKPADMWDDLLGDPSGKPAAKAGGKSAKLAAAKRDAKNRSVTYGIAAAIIVAAAAGIGLFAMNNSSPATGTIVFDWPAADRTDTTVTIDNAPITFPAGKNWEYQCPAGEHRVVAERPGHKLAADVIVVAGQQQMVTADWKPKAVLVLNWPMELRSGATLKIDGHAQTVAQHMPLEIAVEPGKHVVEITRSGSPPFGTMATVAADGRELVTIKPPPTTATLVFDWPPEERKDAELTVDGHTQSLGSEPDGNPFELTVPPGRHVVRIARTGFEPFHESVELSAGTNQPIKPSWTPEQKTAAVADTAPVETAPQPVKKLAPPQAAEIERIGKEVDGLYKTTGAGLKDPTKAQELYDVAAKDGSSPAERYVLLTKGAEIAAAGGDLNLALAGVDTLAAAYEIDALEGKQKLLEKFIAAAKPDKAADAIPVAEQLIDQAVAADEYETALVLATAASHAASKSQIPTHAAIEDRLSRRRHDIRIIEPINAAAKKAQAVLDKNPADAEANLAVGRWRAFYKNDWPTGLPLLAKGSDEKLKSLAA